MAGLWWGWGTRLVLKEIPRLPVRQQHRRHTPQRVIILAVLLGVECVASGSHLWLISWVTNDAEAFSRCMLAICTSSWLECLFSLLSILLLGCLSFYYRVGGVLYTSWILAPIWDLQIFSPILWVAFSLDSVLWFTKVFHFSFIPYVLNLF